MYEAVVNTVPQAKFGPGLQRVFRPMSDSGTGQRRRTTECRHRQRPGPGLRACIRSHPPQRVSHKPPEWVQNIPEVCSIFCATANPVEVIIGKTEQGRGVMGVIDGSPPKGVEGSAEIAARKEFNWWRWHRHLRFTNGVLKDLGEPLCLPGALPA